MTPFHRALADTEKEEERITEALVMFQGVARIGSRVKHWGQRYTESATATVVGFTARPQHSDRHWIRVQVKPDKGDGGLYGTEWDWDRTEIRP